MPRIRFIHTADLHLDSPFAGLQTIAPEVAAVLQRATFDAYEKIIELCLAEQADALLVAGDIYDGADRSLRAQMKFIEGLRRLDGAGIRSFVCHGNHDPLNGWEARLELPPGCHRFGAEVSAAPAFPADPSRAMVYGVSYPQRVVAENLALKFTGVDRGPFNIGLLHANVDNNPEHAPYAPCTLADLERAGIDYWALGHIHNRKVLKRANPTVAYPGNPQGRHPKERGERGVYVVDVNDYDQVTRLEFKPVDVVRWEEVELDVSGLESEQALIDKVDQRLEDVYFGADGSSVVVRLRLTGRGIVHEALSRPETSGGLLSHVNETFAGETPFVWCERIELATSWPYDRDALARGTDFVADVVRLADAATRGPALLAELRAALDPLYSHGAAGRYLADSRPGDNDLRNLAADAEALCLSALLEGENP